MNKQIPSGYKHTKVGIIPEDWELVKLGDIATFLKGNGISKEEITEDGIACIRYGELYTKYKEKINQIYCKTINKNALVYGYKNDVLMPSSGETAIDIATASCLQIDAVALGGDINIIRTKCNGIFLSYYLNVVSKAKIAALAQGASVIHLYSTHLKILPIALPVLEEQEKIAEILSTWENAIARQEQLIEQQQIFIKAMMRQIFSQKIRFNGNNCNNYPAWEEKTLDKIGNIIGGGTPDTKKQEYWNGEINWFTPTELKSKYVSVSNKTISSLGLKKSSAKLLPKQTILLTTRATIGDISICTQECTTNQGFQNIVVNKDKYNNEFVYYLILNNKLKLIEKASGSTFPEISKTELAKIIFLIPLLEEQTKIADFLTSVDAEIINQTEILVQLKQQKKSLMQKLLTGQIRVV
ncbi:MAG TPA: restriction endonuclease subunit S [Aquella sp.]|nr:restriction endonuclease subunit S [Aquella sp.]